MINSNGKSSNMSQVKFIQLGTVSEPKKNYEINGSNEYSTLLSQVIQNRPGAIIFTTFIKSAASKPENEIYVNGQLYSVSGGGSGSGAVYYGTDKVDADGQIINFSSNHEGAVPEKGNVYIYDPADDTGKTNGGNIADCTAYYYDGTKWVAFTGNVNAENVWFPDGVQRTAGWGTKLATTNNTVTTECKNKNLKQLLEYYLVTTLWPSNVTTSQTAAPIFTATDGTITCDDDTEYLLVPNTDTNPTVTFTYTALDSKSMSKTSPYSVYSTISGMTYGYKESESGNRIANTSVNSTPKSITYTISSASGSIQVGKLGKNGAIDSNYSGTTVTVSDTQDKATWTYTVPAKELTDNGSITAISGGTYFKSQRATWKYNDSKVTTITPNNIGPLYYCNNKLEVDLDHTKTTVTTQISLPSEPTGNRSTKTFNYKVYQPIFLYKGTTKINIGDLKFYGSSNTYTFKLNTTLSGETEADNSSKLLLYIPQSATLKDNKLKLGNADYIMEYSSNSDNVTLSVPKSSTENVTLPYKKYHFQTGFSGAGTAETFVTITLS